MERDKEDLFEGPLEMKRSRFFGQKWRKRWGSIERNVFCVFTTQDKTDLRLAISASDIVSVKLGGKESFSEFEIHHADGRHIFFRSENEEVAKRWNDKLFDLAKVSRSNPIIPEGPPRLPILGNLHQIVPNSAYKLMALASKYGEIFPVTFGRIEKIIFCSAEIADEIYNSTDYIRDVDSKCNRALREIKSAFGESMISVSERHALWHKSHDFLMSHLSEHALRQNLNAFFYKSRELLNLWDEISKKGETINPNIWVPTLTTDCASIHLTGHDFQSITDPDPISKYLGDVMNQMAERTYAAYLGEFFASIHRDHMKEDSEIIYERVKAIVDERMRQVTEEGRNWKKEPKDFLEAALGFFENDEKMAINHIGGLLAGAYETTTALVGWLLYCFAVHPAEALKVSKEVEQEIGPDATEITYLQLNKLVYLERFLKETLRLYPPAPFTTDRNTEIPKKIGKYTFPPGKIFSLNILAIHRNEKYWGSDPEKFNPDHFCPENDEKRHPYAWIPFGIGRASCIGRMFAMTVGKIFMVALAQRYQVILAPGTNATPIQLSIHRPVGLQLSIFRKNVSFGKDPQVKPIDPKQLDKIIEIHSRSISVMTPLTEENLVILYGSQNNTSERLASMAAKEFASHGIKVTPIPLDECTKDIANYTLAVIISSTYNGSPPTNAMKFDKWMRGKDNVSLKHLKMAVFGVGSSSWRTFCLFPKRIQEALAMRGALPLVEMEKGDTLADHEETFRGWLSNLMFKILENYNLPDQEKDDKPDSRRVSLSSRPSTSISHNAYKQTGFKALPVKMENVNPGGHPIYHIELKVDESFKGRAGYQAGDHIGILPMNPDSLVKRLLARLTTVDLRSSLSKMTESFDFAEGETSAHFLAHKTDLTGAPSKNLIRSFIDFAIDEKDKKYLEELANNNEYYKKEVINERLNIVDLMEKCQSIKMTLSIFCRYIPKIKPRYYSIASSNIVSSNITIIVGLETYTTPSKKEWTGLCSSFVGKMENWKANPPTLFINSPNNDFHPPALSTPVIMICAGTGFAPFRGFLQTRQQQMKKNPEMKPAKCVLFFGCRSKTDGFIYAQELENFVKEGVLSELHVAFSREAPKAYVQDKMLEQKKELWELLENDAKIFICGSAQRMGKGAYEAFQKIVAEQSGTSIHQASDYIQNLQDGGRYLEDVWN